MNYDIVIGIEIHLELKTKTKMFSDAYIDMSSSANSHCNEIDFALPGVLPTVNKDAIKKAVIACNALNMNINDTLVFDRKNYYYSDLPKGYQITQQYNPIGTNGYLDLYDDSNFTINIDRLHIEEDTAKQYHQYDNTLIDFNRAGIPLIEIVTKPEFNSSKQVKIYLEYIKRLFVYLDISDAKMELGSMRCDINISLKLKDTKVLGNKVEIKNLNSISNAIKAIEYEIIRQSRLLDNNQIIISETRRYDEELKETISMRNKETTIDYKYFLDPNIYPIKLSKDIINDSINEIPISFKDTINKYLNYNLVLNEIYYLLDNPLLLEYFNQTIKVCNDYRLVYNFLTSKLLGLLTKYNIQIKDLKITPNNIGQLLNYIIDKTISTKQSNEILEKMINGDTPKEIINKYNYSLNSNQQEIIDYINQAIQENPQSIIDYQNGKDRAIGFIVGQVMKKTKGQANPALTNQLVLQIFNKSINQ